jgi:hypothetical protein
MKPLSITPIGAVLLAALLFGNSTLRAQPSNESIYLLAAEPTVAALTQDSSRGPAFRPLRIAKWTALLGAVGSATYGFVRSGEADDGYRALDELCELQTTRCAARTPSGAYLDAELEARYQRVRSHDRHARMGLIASQVGIAATVVLFLLDLGNDSRPPDIPYVPKGLGLHIGGQQRIELRLPL